MADRCILRLRITFAKTEAMRYTSHLDLHRSWERAMRRAGLPLLYSQGFNPRPRLQLAAALPLGFTSRCELLDAWLGEDGRSVDEIRAALESALPPGIRLLEIHPVELDEPALQTRVRSVEYSVTLLDPVEGVEDRLDRLNEAQYLLRERRGKPYDLKPLIEDLQLLPPDEDGCHRLHMALAAQEGHTGRPEEVLAELGYDPAAARVERTRLVVE
jgi:radical SAM-linked protein